MSGRPELSIVIPAYDEMQRLPATVETVLGYLDDHPGSQLVLVDDGSADGTGRFIESEAREDDRIVPVLLSPNRGKGGALRAGMRKSAGERIVFFDADLEYGLDAVDRARSRIDAGADLAIGARDLAAGGSRRAASPTRKLASSGFNALVRLGLDLSIRDTQCGMKMFRHDVAHALFDELTIEGFGFDVEILHIAQLWDLRIDLVPLEMRGAPGSSVHVVSDGIRMARDIASIWLRTRRGRYPPRPSHL